MRQTIRHRIQAAAALFTNADFANFFTGRVHRGASKNLCVPGLNCYSCPGALGACPIGSLQAALGSRGRHVSYYVVGLLLFFGAVFGRLICGFLCPFGFLQDLLDKIPLRKRKVPRRADRLLRRVKYGILVVMVIAVPMIFTDSYGLGSPVFCKYLCPAGTLEGGIPLLLANPALREAAGWLFSWKMLILLAVAVASMLLYRPFCKYLCPLGAFYGLLNRVSLYRMEVDHAKCTNCGACERACKMQVEVRRQINSAECIRCGACREACAFDAIHSGFGLRDTEKKQPPDL
jgi:polyferredoxin